MASVVLPADEINDWESFHGTCKTVFGFPDFYGANMNAWIDCLSYLRDGDGMSRFALGSDEYLDIEIPHAEAFRERAREVFDALIDCTAFVNRRYTDIGELPVIRLILL